VFAFGLHDFNSQTPKDLAFVNVYSAFSHDWDNLYWQSSNVVAEGATPMITWMPIDLARREDNLLPEIALGYWDEYITQWGIKLLAWVNMYPESERPRLAIRFAHEFNGNWYPYSNTPVAYTAAWQTIHDQFEQMGVNEHVDWVWRASKTNVDDFNDFTVYYPGDNYVDWTALDGYNWGSNYASNGWTSFKDLFADTYNILVQNYPNKPIMISETASAEPHDIPNIDYGMYGDNTDANESKSNWINKMLLTLESDFPAVRALAIFNINKELSWSISSEANTGLSEWITGTQRTHFTSDLLVASALTQDTSTDIRSKKGKGKKQGKKKRTTERNLMEQSLGTVSTNRRIDTQKQSKRARMATVSAKSTKKNKQLSDTLKNLSVDKKKQYKKMKISVIEY